MKRLLPIMFLTLAIPLASCGGKDYSSNQYIKESTTYYQLLKSENYFTFNKDGTGKLQLDKFTYNLKFDIRDETYVAIQWEEVKMGDGTFSISSTGYRQFSWSGNTFTSYSK